VPNGVVVIEILKPRKSEVLNPKFETISNVQNTNSQNKNTSDILDSRLRGNDNWWGKPHPTKTSGKNRTLHDFIDKEVPGEYSIGNYTLEG